MDMMKDIIQKKKPIISSRIRGGVNYIGNNNYIVYPKDAQFIATNIYGATQGDITGCLRITLPVSWDNSILSFVVSIYNYLPNTSVIYYISGYNYAGAPSSGDFARWHSCTAICVGEVENPLANLPVKFSHNGEKCVVEIGPHYSMEIPSNTNT